MYDKYVPVVVGGLAVLAVGKWNPDMLQQKDQQGRANGCPDPRWLALIALATGLVSAYVLQEAKKQRLLSSF